MAATYNERMMQKFQNLLFVFNMINMLALYNIYLFHGFDGHLICRILLEPCVFHIAEGA